jgi:hypothetical protein
LQVSRASIGTDVLYLRSQAKESIREYVTEHLLSNATTIDSALHYVRNKQQEQNKRLSLDLTSNDSNNSDDTDHLTRTAGRQTVF